MVSLRTLFGREADILQDGDMQILLVAGLTGPLGAALLSPLLDTMAGEFGVSTARIGLLMAAFTAPSIVLIPVFGMLSDRIGRKPVLAGGLVLFGVGGAGVAFTTDFTIALALRLLQGIGAAGIVPIIITSLGDIYSGAAETTAQGFRFMSSGLTQTVFPAIAGFLVVFGWQYPVLMYGMGVVIALVVLVGLDEPSDPRLDDLSGDPSADPSTDSRSDGPPADSRPSTDTRPDGSPPDDSPESPSSTDSSPTDSSPGNDGDGGEDLSLLDALRRRRVLGLLAAYGMPAFMYVGFITYVSILVVRLLGGTAGQAGLLVAITNLMKAVSASQAGRIAAAFDRQILPLVGANASMGAGLTVVAFAPSVPVAGVGVVLLGAGSGLILSLYRSLLTGLAPERVRGGVVSAGESLIRLTMTVAPVLAGAAIALATPAVGFDAAVRLMLFGLAAVGVGLSVVALLVARPLRVTVTAG